jgi:hypothetical protein
MERNAIMWVLRASLAACLLLGGCAAPLIQAAIPGVMPKTPVCAPGMPCPGDVASAIPGGFGRQFLFLPGTSVVTEQPASK